MPGFLYIFTKKNDNFLYILPIVLLFLYDIIILSRGNERKINKMIEKNRKKELAKKNRVWFNMNTGTRLHKSAKYPTREDNKKRIAEDA